MTTCRNSAYIASSATANDQLVGKRNASRTPLRRPLTSFNIDVANWEACAQDRLLWRSMIHIGTICPDRVTGETNAFTSQCKLHKGHNSIRNYDAQNFFLQHQNHGHNVVFQRFSLHLSPFVILIIWTLHRRLCIDMK